MQREIPIINAHTFQNALHRAKNTEQVLNTLLNRQKFLSIFTCLEGIKWRTSRRRRGKTFLNTFSGFEETSKFADWDDRDSMNLKTQTKMEKIANVRKNFKIFCKMRSFIQILNTKKQWKTFPVISILIFLPKLSFVVTQKHNHSRHHISCAEMKTLQRHSQWWCQTLKIYATCRSIKEICFFSQT